MPFWEERPVRPNSELVGLPLSSGPLATAWADGRSGVSLVPQQWVRQPPLRQCLPWR